MILVVVHHGKTRLKWCCKQASSPEQCRIALESSLLFLWPFIDGVEVIGILVHCAAVQRQKYQQNSSSKWKIIRLDLNAQLSAFNMMTQSNYHICIGQRYHDHLKNLLQPANKCTLDYFIHPLRQNKCISCLLGVCVCVSVYFYRFFRIVRSYDLLVQHQ